MSARSKRRRKITVDGNTYYWYVHDELVLRVYSENKKFIIHYELLGENPLMVIHGEYFNGCSEKARPIWVTPPNFDIPFGPQLVKVLIMWTLKEQNIKVNLGVPNGPLQRFLNDSSL